MLGSFKVTSKIDFNGQWFGCGFGEFLDSVVHYTNLGMCPKQIKALIFQAGKRILQQQQHQLPALGLGHRQHPGHRPHRWRGLERVQRGLFGGGLWWGWGWYPEPIGYINFLYHLDTPRPRMRRKMGSQVVDAFKNWRFSRFSWSYVLSQYGWILILDKNFYRFKKYLLFRAYLG